MQLGLICMGEYIAQKQNFERYLLSLAALQRRRWNANVYHIYIFMFTLLSSNAVFVILSTTHILKYFTYLCGQYRSGLGSQLVLHFQSMKDLKLSTTNENMRQSVLLPIKILFSFGKGKHQKHRKRFKKSFEDT